MTHRYVALLRGVNVGRAKRVAMADLREIVEDLGFADVKTLANSGNVVFSAPGKSAGDAAGRIERALAERLSIASRVTLLDAGELAEAMRHNPLLELATEHARLLVAVLADPADREKLLPLAQREWSPEALALGGRVAYLWCPEGQIESHVAQAVGRALGDAVTTRNWTTMTKLLAMVAAPGK